MSVTPATIWSATLGLNFLCWVLFPEVRTALSLVLMMHVPFLIWGVFDIRSQFFGRVFICNPAKHKSIALTFDDGPDPECTPAVLDLLRDFGFKATFFFVGVRAQKYPDLVKRAFDDGHQVACHDLKHALTGNFRMKRRMHREVAKAKSMLEKITGVTVSAYRPPVGLMNPHVIPVCTKLGMICTGWSRSAVDGGNRRLKRIRMIHGLCGPGEIIMMHDTLPISGYREEFLANLRGLFETIQICGLTTERIDSFIPGEDA